MDAKTWLMRGWKLNHEIDRLMEVRDITYARLTSVTASLDGDVVQSTKDPHKMDRLMECESALDETIDMYADTVAEITRAIRSLSDPRHRALLEDRYLLYKSWELIAVEEHYNIRHVWRLHKEALQAIAEKIAVDCQS